jgi:DNA ligase-1
MALENPGDTTEYQGSGSSPYKLKNHDGRIFSCSCISWKTCKGDVHQKTCKHLRAVRGEAIERARVGGSPVPAPVAAVRAVQAPKAAPMAAPGAPLVSPGCACERGSSCDVSHDPATCPCRQCTSAEREAQEEVRLGRKLRPDEKTKLNGPPLLQANSVEDEKDFDPKGWWMSEKLDGVRAYWNGSEFITRQGNIYRAPDWFTAGLPNHPLDGELWMGRRKFQKTISVVKSGPSEDWRDVKYLVFDAPHLDSVFEERVKFIENLCVRGAAAFMYAVAQTLIRDAAHLEELFEELVKLGAEGAMLRKPQSKYQPGRNSTILKKKPWKDAEAKVIAHTDGKKANKGVTGALVVQMPNGKTFNVGSGLTAENRRNPPPIGCTITYKFMDVTDDGIPKGASFVAVRDYE